MIGSCTIPATSPISGANVYVAGAPGTNGAYAGNAGVYTLTNSAQVLTLPQQNEGLYLRLEGGRGNDGSNDYQRGGDSGAVNIINSGNIGFGPNSQAPASSEDSDDGTRPGVWDDPGRGVAIYGAAIGGFGGGLSGTGVGGHDGGDGGHTNAVTISNTGVLQLTGLPLTNGGAGILGTAVTGRGGDQDDAPGDQHGGAAGDGDDPLTITNSGAITLHATSVGHYLWGIGGESIGELGGLNNGNGGMAAPTTINNTGAISVSADALSASVPIDAGIRGIYASSFGGPGTFSSDGSDNGGAGEQSQRTAVTTGGSITVSVNGLSQPTDGYRPTTNNGTDDPDAPVDNPQNLGRIQQSGGIVAIGKGGDGGSGPQTIGSFGDKKGGVGGDTGVVAIDVEDGADVTTTGDYLPGVMSISAGGLGGDGRENSAGADGGSGGTAAVTLGAGSVITTRGQQSYGVVARGQGGNGGDYIPSSGAGDFRTENAGQGGRSAYISLSLGDADIDNHVIGTGLTDPAGRAGVQTYSDYSPGIVGQSIGGVGGATGDSFDLFGQTGASTGNGGAGNGVNAYGTADIVTEGEYSRGIVLQSIGGNGGIGGESSGFLVLGGAGGVGGAAGPVTGVFGGTVQTSGTSAVGILAQAVGGGGGSADGTVGVGAVGGQGGTGGATAASSVTFLAGSISTAGDYAYGMEIQSIGGGGGDGGAALSVTSVPTMPTVGIGGMGGVAGDGASATATNKDSNGVAGGAVTLATLGDNAHGVLAQSIGGGGGTGGDANGGGLTIASFQMAGSGGSGGKGGTVSLDFDGLTASTSGAHAAGLISQSIGGGGGTGGSAYSNTANLGFSLAIGVGGNGSGGGNGGAAMATLVNGAITTGLGVGVNGDTSQTITDAHGIVVQSVGGGGGIAGSSTARAVVKTVPVEEETSFGAAVSIAVGGKGGNGGSGGSVIATLDNSQILTNGDGSVGIVAQSIGGGGGIGGSASAMSAIIGNPFESDDDDDDDDDDEEEPSDSTTYSANVDVGIGGSGGSGGYGGTASVTLENSASVTTWGDQANAVVLQSIGGGGGTGGTGTANSKDRNEGKNLKFNLGVGGTGSGGGSGSVLSFYLQPGTVLTTNGEGARGVLGQSIGGGGGNSQGISIAGGVTGAPVSANIQVGRNGGGGGGGSAIPTALLAGQIVTQGADADGVMLQSIGGGGGAGGSFGGTSAQGGILQTIQAFQDDDSTSVDVTVVVGGDGGAGGNGGNIGDATPPDDQHGMRISGTVATYGDFADGIVLQTIGGGGGTGGNAATQDSSAKVRSFIGVGGQGGAGGNGGNMYIQLADGSVSTQGVSAQGVLMQSIGGGGGQGGTGSRLACGLLAVGGGILAPDFLSDAGANSNLDDDQRCATVPSIRQVQDGGYAAGDGGLIETVGTTGSMTVNTQGDDATAIIAQSIGGGGGASAAGSSNSSQVPQGSGQPQSFSIMLGGQSDARGSGGDVSLDGIFHVQTSGDRAMGLVAQSIGGGGGLATMNGAWVNELAIGGDGAQGEAQNGDSVEISHLAGGRIATSGAAAHGLVAQSIGGGGGIGGDTSVGPLSLNNYGANVAFGYNPDQGGYGSIVEVTADGDIATSGRGAFGIIAQSIAGGGGLGGAGSAAFAGATGPGGIAGGTAAGAVNVTVNGSVSATGENAAGVFAQSQGPSGNGGIGVNVIGSVVGGTGAQGTGILISAGNGLENEISVASGGSVSAGSGVAVFYQADTNNSYSGLTVTNSGTIDGDVVGHYANGSPISGVAELLRAVPSGKSGKVTSGLAAVSLTNNSGGVLSGARSYAADVVNNGTLIIGEAAKSNNLSVAGRFSQGATGVTEATIDFAAQKGDYMSVAGDVALAGTLEIDPLSIIKGGKHRVLSSGGGIAGAFASVDSTLIRYGLTQDSSNSIWVEVLDSQFDAAPGLGKTERSVARYLDRIFDSGSHSYATLFAAAEQIANSGTGYADVLAGLSGGASGAGAAINTAVFGQRFDRLMHCGEHSFTSAQPAEPCMELYGSGEYIDYDDTNQVIGYNGHVYSLGVSGRWQGSGDIDFGGSIGLERVHATGIGNSRAEGTNVQAGISATQTFGAWSLTGAFVGSYGSFDTSRRPSVTDPDVRAKGSYDAYSAGVRLRTAYTYELENAYIRPMLDLDAIYTSADGYTESGAGELDLDVSSSDQTYFRATPSVEVGTVFDLGNGMGARAFAQVGYMFASNDSYTTSARFGAADPGLGGFNTGLAQPDDVGLISVGMQLVGNENLDLALRYDGAFGDDTSSNALSFRMEARF